MELMKRQIRKSQTGKRIVDQFVVDDDYNVPDAKEDVKRIVLSEGNLKIDEVRPVENYIRVIGKLYFKVLYVAESMQPRLASLEGKLPFEEMVYAEEEGDVPFVVCDTKVDFSASVIHSRKLDMKAMVELTLCPERIVEEELAVDIESDVPVYKKQRECSLLKLQTSKKDTYRIKEEITIPGTKETIGNLLWCDVSARKLDTRLSEGELLVNGELFVFCFYESPDGKPDWMEQAVPYEGRVEVNGAESSMYHHVSSEFGDVNVDVRPDEDGEMRVIGMEGTLSLRIAVYEEETVELLEDVYSLQVQCRPETAKVSYEEPVLQNHSKCKVTERLSLPELQDDILQICHSSGMVQVENMTETDEGILVEGVLHVSFLYVKANDGLPFDVWQGMLPFSHLIACSRTGHDIRYDITNAMEQLSISLLGGDSVEVKAVLAFHCFLRNVVETTTMTDVKTEELPMEELSKSPGIVGYVVKDGDDLWTLAKRYHTTIDGIREINELQNEEIKTGDRILIFKENVSIL